MKKIMSVVVLLLLGGCSPVSSTPSKIFENTVNQLKNKIKMRFVVGQLADSDLATVLRAVNKSQGVKLSASMFKLTDNTPLLTSDYRRYALTIDDVEVSGSTIRIWKNKFSKQLIQAEVIIQSEEAPAFEVAKRNFSEIIPVAKKEITAAFKQNQIKTLNTKHIWIDGVLTRLISVKATRGKYEFYFSNTSNKIIKQTFKPYESSDAGQSFDANLYKIWEWANDGNSPVSASELQPRQKLRVNNIKNYAYEPSSTQLKKIANTVFLYSNYEDGYLSPDEIAKGMWNDKLMSSWFPKFFMEQGQRINNEFGLGNSVKLYGENVAVFIHPDAAKLAISSLNSYAPHFCVSTSPTPDNDNTVLNLRPAYWGKPAYTSEDFINRQAVDESGNPRMHDTAWLMENGFDELQVYYAVDTFLDSLRKLGFKDPDISTRPFAAILFDPDIGMRDNAYYDSDSINFTTYSENYINMARDNSTIWHELGHGIMDRLMGANVNAVEGFGLWEGIADLMAELLVVDQMGEASFPGREKFRINNEMWFHNSNETHDDGESYGGVMRDLLLRLIGRFGEREGLLRMSDLVFETMRLTRDNSEITPVEWFEHMKYADTLSRSSLIKGRLGGDLTKDIDAVLAKRNYALNQKPARMWLSYEGKEISENALGSRNSQIKEPVDALAKQYLIDIHVEDGEVRKFSYPVTVKVSFNGGPLQGPVSWNGEENGPLTYIISSPDQTISVPLATNGKCDSVNTEAGLCEDYVYISLYNSLDTNTKPVAKNRFYINLVPSVQ